MQLTITKVQNGVIVGGNEGTNLRVFTSYYELRNYLEKELGPMEEEKKEQTLADKVADMAETLEEFKSELQQ